MFKANYKPNSAADISGGENYPGIRGRVIFRQQKNGVLVTADIYGLPTGETGCDSGVFGFHIHEGEDCGSNGQEPFSNTKGHYNPGSVRIRTMREICRLYLKMMGMRICHF